MWRAVVPTKCNTNTRAADGYRIEPGVGGWGTVGLWKHKEGGECLVTGRMEKQREARDAP